MHGSNRLGGNSLSDLLVFGRRAGDAAAAYAAGLGERAPTVADDRRDGGAEQRALAPFEIARAARTRTRSSRTSSRR